MNKSILTTILFCLLPVSAALAGTSGRTHFLFNNGRSSYVILANAIPEARELQSYIKRISDVEIPLESHVSKHNVHVGYSHTVRMKMTEKGISLDKDGAFCYFGDEKGDVYIFGKGRMGTLYGVYAFLENELGCRWYSSDCELVPKRKSYSFSKLCCKESPAIERRYVMYAEAKDPAWCLKARNNGINDFFSCHTFDLLLPPERYFEKHPEFFSMIDGKRLGKDTQLCLSNPHVLEIVTGNLLTYIENYPGHLIYDVSQNDNLNYCQCAECQALAKQYGGQSGLMVHFVNKVAAYVAEKYPDKLIGTFAYKYSRTPPTGIKPAHNVVIRLCSIECCFAHSFAGCERNKAFFQDVRKWSSLTDKVYVWDYVTNFSEYCLPNPNFRVLQANIRYLRDNHVIGVLDEGNYQGKGGEFAPLRSYLLAKLLWNPDRNVESLVDDFMSGYYGPSGVYVRKYYDLLLDLVDKDIHFGINFYASHEMYSTSFIERSRAIFADALAAADSEMIRNRVELAMMPVCYLECKLTPRTAKSDGAYALVKRVIEREGIKYLYERYGNVPNSEDFLRSME